MFFSAFLILGIGLLLSCMVFITEKTCYYMKMVKIKPQNPGRQSETHKEMNSEKFGKNIKGTHIVFSIFAVITLGLLTFILVKIFSSDNSPLSCESGWIDGTHVNMGCILFEESKMNYSEALDFCSTRSGMLVEILAPIDMEFIISHLEELGEPGWWGGASDAIIEGAWYWRLFGTQVGWFLWTHGYPPVYNVYENHICFLKENNFKGEDCASNLELNPVCQKNVNYIK